MEMRVSLLIIFVFVLAKTSQTSISSSTKSPSPNDSQGSSHPQDWTAWKTNNISAIPCEDIVLECRVRLIDGRKHAEVNWLHINNKSLLTYGNFKLTRNSRIDIDKKDYTRIGIRWDYQVAIRTLIMKSFWELGSYQLLIAWFSCFRVRRILQFLMKAMSLIAFQKLATQNQEGAAVGQRMLRLPDGLRVPCISRANLRPCEEWQHFVRSPRREKERKQEKKTVEANRWCLWI